jgi:hypothetical protein
MASFNIVCAKHYRSDLIVRQLLRIPPRIFLFSISMELENDGPCENASLNLKSGSILPT